MDDKLMTTNYLLDRYMQNITPEEKMKRVKQLGVKSKRGRDILNVGLDSDLNVDYGDYSLFDKQKLKIKRTQESELDVSVVPAPL